jgi:hypothetical protein
VADRTGLTGGLSRALATSRLLIHVRGRILADLAAAIAVGAEVREGPDGDQPAGWPPSMRSARSPTRPDRHNQAP